MATIYSVICYLLHCPFFKSNSMSLYVLAFYVNLHCENLEMTAEKFKFKV